MSVGRRPNTADIGLDAVGLEPNRAVPVDDTMSVASVAGEWLYAVGDVNGRAPFTHRGKYAARIAVDALMVWLGLSLAYRHP